MCKQTHAHANLREPQHGQRWTLQNGQVIGVKTWAFFDQALLSLNRGQRIGRATSFWGKHYDWISRISISTPAKSRSALHLWPLPGQPTKKLKSPMQINDFLININNVQCRVNWIFRAYWSLLCWCWSSFGSITKTGRLMVGQWAGFVKSEASKHENRLTMSQTLPVVVAIFLTLVAQLNA